MRWFTLPIMPVLLVTAQKDIVRLVKKTKQNNNDFSILDVGGRKSPYTVNVPAEITLLDVPQENNVQEKLNLGFTTDLLDKVKKVRSNINNIIIEDMTKSTLSDASFNAVVCVEVIEHVEEDDIFIKNVSNVINKNGWAYFTTPNGDYIKNVPPNYNPDHKRHYTRQQLQELLERHFDRVSVKYAVKTGKHRVWGLKSFKIKKPWRLVKSIFGNIVNRFESKGIEETANGTAHLIAIAYK
ncbi:MAG: methyltransferase domain-containing protein [Psychroserpens sp.]|uniref:methyltransferase domain-containing protein n=1 Tax=Psychroserpens sp. TaxID=2020870 RepID=UPI003002B88B